MRTLDNVEFAGLEGKGSPSTVRKPGWKLGRVAPVEKALPPSVASVLDRLDTELSKRIVMPEAERTAVVLWIAHTYVYDRFKHTPRLLVTSAGPAMGKTELLRLVADLSHGGERSTKSHQPHSSASKTYRPTALM